MKRILGIVAGLSVLAGLAAAIASLYGLPVLAATPPPGPTTGAVGVEGTIPSPAPSQAATIATPGNGQTLTNSPITVSGLCPANTLVKIFSNDIFVGSVDCTNGSYTLQVSLFSGRNDLIARVFDALDQQGPDSAATTVTFNDANFGQFGSYVLLTSQYARRAADPNVSLTWPIIVSSGLGPYALSVDWGDGTPSELSSQPFAGTFDLKHAYRTPGVYHVTFKVTDKNGTTGFLQVVAIANGEVTGDTAAGGTGKTEKTIVIKKQMVWWPMAVLIVPVLCTFWLGQRYALLRLRRKLQDEV